MAGSTSPGITGDFDFHCTACGRCCNSPPRLSLAELLTHGDTFLAALVVQARPRWQVGQRVPLRAGAHHSLDADDIATERELAQGWTAPLPGGGRLELHLQGIQAPSLSRCPALTEDGRCRLHGPGKPAMCGSVPFDPGLPDRWQALVVHRRLPGAPEDLGADCLRPAGASPGADWAPLLQAGTVAQESDRAQLRAQRRARELDWETWGRAIATELVHGGALERLRVQPTLTLPIAPVIVAVLRSGHLSADEVVSLLERQIDLHERAIASALRHRQTQDRAFTQLLRQHREVLQRLLSRLAGAGSDVMAA